MGALNINNAFETISNVFRTLATRLKHLKRVLNISNAIETFKTKVANISNVFCFKYVANVQNALLIFKTRCEYSKDVSNVPNGLII